MPLAPSVPRPPPPRSHSNCRGRRRAAWWQAAWQEHARSPRRQGCVRGRAIAAPPSHWRGRPPRGRRPDEWRGDGKRDDHSDGDVELSDAIRWLPRRVQGLVRTHTHACTHFTPTHPLTPLNLPFSTVCVCVCACVCVSVCLCLCVCVSVCVRVFKGRGM